MELSKKQIELRKNLTDEYNINLFSASEPRISKELFLHFLSQKTGIKKFDLKSKGVEGFNDESSLLKQLALEILI